MKKTRFGLKLICYFIVVVLFALLMCTMLMRNEMKVVLEDNMELTSQQTMKEAVNEFQRYMKTLSLPVDLMCRRNELKKIDENYNEDSIKVIEDALLGALKVIEKSERTYYATGSGKYIQAKLLIDAEGKKTGDYIVQEGVDKSAENWYADSIGLGSRHTVFCNFTVPSINEEGVEVFTVSQNLKASDQHVGVVAMEVNADALKEYINNIKLMNTGYTLLADSQGNIIINNERNQLISASATEIPVWSELIANIQAMLDEETEEELNPMASLPCKIAGEKYYVTVIQDTITGWYLVGFIGEEENAASFLSVAIMSNIAIAAGLVCAIIVASLVAYSIAKELKKITAATESMAKGDLSQKLVVTRRDEFGQLEHNFNDMIASMALLIQKVGNNSHEILEIANSVMEVSENTKEVANQVTIAINSVAVGATEQAQSTQEANVEVDQLAENLSDSKNKVDIIGDKSRNTEQLSRQGTAILAELTDKSEKAKKNAAESIETMTEMLKSIEKINYISDAIADITDQTNLLSLNASIEAARAGDSGRGFAVVADEIRKLADQSKESTEEIKSILLEIMDNSKQVENSLQESGRIQEEQQQSILQSEKLFEEIEKSVKNLLTAVKEIEVLNEDMAVARDRVVHKMENIASVSETAAAATEEVTASAEQVNTTMAEVAQHAKVLDDIVHQLNESINEFKFG